MDNDKLDSIKDSFGYSVWEKPDENHTVIRLVTSFMTKKEEIDELLLLF
jgi:threonine aldolase